MEEMEMIDAQTAIYIQKEQDTYSIIALWQQIYGTSWSFKRTPTYKRMTHKSNFK